MADIPEYQRGGETASQRRDDIELIHRASKSIWW
jgi:hypothetical protein